MIRALMTCLLILLALNCPQSHAEETIVACSDTEGSWDRFTFTDAEPFDVVIVTNTDHFIAVVEFTVTDLPSIFPGVFRIGVGVPGTHLDMGQADGRVMCRSFFGYPTGGPCAEPGTNEVMRLTYLDLDGTALQGDVVLRVGGLKEDDPWFDSSPFGGQPGYINCKDEGYELALEPWSEFGMPDDENLAGAVVLNPTWFPVDAHATSLSALKARY